MNFEHEEQNNLLAISYWLLTKVADLAFSQQQ